MRRGLLASPYQDLEITSEDRIENTGTATRTIEKASGRPEKPTKTKKNLNRIQVKRPAGARSALCGPLFGPCAARRLRRRAGARAAAARGFRTLGAHRRRAAGDPSDAQEVSLGAVARRLL